MRVSASIVQSPIICWMVCTSVCEFPVVECCYFPPQCSPQLRCYMRKTGVTIFVGGGQFWCNPVLFMTTFFLCWFWCMCSGWMWKSQMFCCHGDWAFTLSSEIKLPHEVWKLSTSNLEIEQPHQVSAHSWTCSGLLIYPLWVLQEHNIEGRSD